MKLSFGFGIAFVPFGLVISSEYVLAASYGIHLSNVVATVVSPFAFGLVDGELAAERDELPTSAVLVPEEVDFEAITEPSKVSKGKRAPKKSGLAPELKALPAIQVPAATVLHLANSGKRPTGKSVIAEGRRPAGVQVFGASCLGVGVRDGDVITRVSGVPVTSANQVIALVIAARGARQRSISAQVFRGQRSYGLTVEQPYLDGAQEPPNSRPDSPSGAEPGAEMRK